MIYSSITYCVIIILIFCFQYEAEAPGKKAPPTSLLSASLKEQAKDSRRSSRSKPLRKKKSGSTTTTVDTPGSDEVAKELGGAKSEQGEGQGVGEEQEVWSQEDDGGGDKVLEVSEDVRKTEDSLAVIHRHAEAEDEKVQYTYMYMCSVLIVAVSALVTCTVDLEIFV